MNKIENSVIDTIICAFRCSVDLHSAICTVLCTAIYPSLIILILFFFLYFVVQDLINTHCGFSVRKKKLVGRSFFHQHNSLATLTLITQLVIL